MESEHSTPSRPPNKEHGMSWNRTNRSRPFRLRLASRRLPIAWTVFASAWMCAALAPAALAWGTSGFGVPVTTFPTPVTATDVQAIADGAGGTYVLWRDTRSGSGDIFLQ